jgi:hypothetical protein
VGQSGSQPNCVRPMDNIFSKISRLNEALHAINPKYKPIGFSITSIESCSTSGTRLPDTKRYQFGYLLILPRGSWNGKCWSIQRPFVIILRQLGIFYIHLVYFTSIWYILRPFGRFYVFLVYLVVILYIFLACCINIFCISDQVDGRSM